MVNLVKEAQESRKKIILSAMVGILVIIAALPLFVLSGALAMETWLRAVLIGIGSCVIIGGIIIACILDREAGAFECPQCGNRFVPEMKAYIMGPHTLTKRRLTCPCCGETRYCKHVLTKQKRSCLSEYKRCQEIPERSFRNSSSPGFFMPFVSNSIRLSVMCFW